MATSIVILAAGEGRRMRSKRPKVLQPLGEGTLLDHVLQAAAAASPAQLIVVVGHQAQQVQAAYPALNCEWVHQPRQQGTADALACALPAISADHGVVVLYGDVPLLTPDTVRRLADRAQQAVVLATTQLADPTGYGRIVRDDAGELLEVVEERDATEAQRRLCEVNTGMLAAPARWLRALLPQVDCDNAQREYYLPAVLPLARQAGHPLVGIAIDEEEAAGANDRAQLAGLEARLRRRRVKALLQAGVTVRDPARLDVRGNVVCEADVELDVGVVLEGEVELGADVHVGAHCILRNCRIGPNARIEPHSLIDGAVIGAGCSVGPYARLRPGTRLAERARVGNFVEVKAAGIGTGSKVNHLSYIGDAELGAGVNVGAGTITCNYDGRAKHRTEIGDGAFVGSNTTLVAPVSVGAQAVVGAATLLRHDAPATGLTFTAVEQRTIPDWSRADD